MASANISNFVHETLSQGEIRLLDLEPATVTSSIIVCSTHVVKLSQAPSYEALSYRWGDASVTDAVIVNGNTFRATTNLVSALRRLRERGKSHYLWIDAICIDQASTEDKNLQVPMMAAIYSRASCVLIWLGEAAENSSAAFALLERWATAIDEARTADERTLLAKPLTSVLRFAQDPFNEAARDGLERLTQRSYWSRVWIVQEIVLARTRWLLCGSDEMHWDRFHHSMSFFQDLLSLNSVENQITADKVSRMIISSHAIKAIMLAILQRVAHRRDPKAPKERPLRVIGESAFCQATDPRDKIYGMLGLLDSNGDEPFIRPDYCLTLEQVYVDFVTAEIRSTGRLDALAFAGMGGDQRLGTLPSWAFAASSDSNHVFGYGFLATVLQIGDGEYNEAKLPKWDASGGREAGFTFLSPHILQVCGLVCDTVTRMSKGNIERPWSDMDWIWDWISLAKSPKIWPYSTTWRRTFWLAALADEYSFGPTRDGFLSPEKEAAYYQQTEAVMSFMRYYALRTIRNRLALHSADGDADLPEELPINEDATIYIDRLRNFEEVDEEVVYWAQNSSATSDLHLRKQRLEAFCGTPNSAFRLEWPFEEYGCLSYGHALTIMITKLRARSGLTPFMITQTGLFGLVPPRTRIGDLVCCVDGCAVPLIVRKLPDGTAKLVGEAYVYGMMWGEKANEVSSGKLREEDFVFI
jgi:hypothetical protein